MSGNVVNFSEQDHVWLNHAIDLAKRAEQLGEVPVGSVLISEGQIIGEGWNQVISNHDPTCHAEIVAIREAGKQLKNYRLVNATLYTTLEPCAMCVGAIVHARIARLVYGAPDPKSGAVDSAIQLANENFLNHRLEITQGVFAEECGAILKNFFKVRR